MCIPAYGDTVLTACSDCKGNKLSDQRFCVQVYGNVLKPLFMLVDCILESRQTPSRVNGSKYEPYPELGIGPGRQ